MQVNIHNDAITLITIDFIKVNRLYWKLQKQNSQKDIKA